MLRDRCIRPSLFLAAIAGLVGSAHATSPAAVDADAGTRDVVQVDISTPTALARASRLAESIWTCRPRVGGPVELLVTPAQRRALERAGFDPETVIRDVDRMAEMERIEIDRLNGLRDTAWFQNWRTLAEYEAYWAQLAADFPQIATLDVIGQSLEGRDVRRFVITGPNGATPVADRPVILFNGCQHAREWISPMTVTYIADQLARQYGNDTRVTALLDEVVFHIVPMVNPDGYDFSWNTGERFWRKNRRDNGNGTFGVDLNRNWAEFWGGSGSSGSTSSDVYRGPAPFSEPETQNLRDLANSTPNLVAHIDYHSFSQLLLYPFGGAAQLPAEPDNTFFANLTQDMSALIQAIDGRFYDPIPSFQLYIAAGDATDWFYADRGVYSLTIELPPATSSAGGFAPSSTLILPTAIENFEAAVLFAERVTSPLTIRFPQGRPSTAPSQGIAEIVVEVAAGTEPVGGAPTLFYKAASETGYTSVTMSATGGADTFAATVPTGDCGDAVQYYVEASSAGGAVADAGSALNPYSIEVFDDSLIAQTVFDDLESSVAGWIVGVPGDTATTGLWELADPQGTAAQPENDASEPGTDCFVTDGTAGTSVGSFDIDGGTTTLISPRLDATSDDGVTAFIAYSRWYSNNQGADPNNDVFPISISNDDGATWVGLESVTENANAWVRAEFRVSDFVTPTDQIRLRFVAQDLGAGSVVEAGVDDLELFFIGCPAPEFDPADLTGPSQDGIPDGTVDASDLTYFLNQYVAQFGGVGDVDLTGPSQDGNPDGVVDASDLTFFLDLYIAAL